MPGAPDPPYTVLQNEQTIELAWDAPADDGASTLTGYILYWDEGDELLVNSFQELVRTDAATTSFAKTTGLETG